MSLLSIFMIVMISGSAGKHDWTLVGRDICAADGDAGKKFDSFGFFCYFFNGKEVKKVCRYEK
jgi:hypothetical protein